MIYYKVLSICCDKAVQHQKNKDEKYDRSPK